MASVQDAILHFDGYDEPVQLNYEKALTYAKTKKYDPKTFETNKWHEIIVKHHGRGSKKDILEELFDTVEDEEFLPIAYRCGRKEDRFLIRQCKNAIDKLFDKSLCLRFSNCYINLEIKINVADFNAGQISAFTEISNCVKRLYSLLITVDGTPRILNLSNFSANYEFKDIIVNLGNKSVFERVCRACYHNENFRSLKGILLSGNNISCLTPMKEFDGCRFDVLNLKQNNITSVARLCQDLRNIKADDLMLAENPVITAKDYPEGLSPILSNFKRVDGKVSENLTKEYSPLDSEIDLSRDGYLIDCTNKSDVRNFQGSDDWHAVIIPDRKQAYAKEQILDYFFIYVSPDLEPIYPCYYKYAHGEHHFLVRNCFKQLVHLIENCNFEIKVPLLSADDTIKSGDSIIYLIRMNVSPFQHGQVEPSEALEKALLHRFNAMNRLLNLSKFQETPGLENIIFHLSSPKVLHNVLLHASRKFSSNCIELRLKHNKICDIPSPKSLKAMTMLKAIDLGNNWIQSLDNLAGLREFDIKTLVLDGNPLCSNYAVGTVYIKEVKKFFPNLIKLDNIEIAKGNLNIQKNYLNDGKIYDLIDDFVPKFFESFQKPSERKLLKDLYAKDALFTLTFKLSSRHKETRIGMYYNMARDIHGARGDPMRNVHIGRDNIMKAIKRLPDLTFDFFNFLTDVPIANRHQMIVIIVNGVFNDMAPDMMESNILMAFSRTLVLCPKEFNLGILKCSSHYEIVNDQFSIFDPTDSQRKTAFNRVKNNAVSSKNEITVTDREALLIMFRELTNLKSIWCTRCLEGSKWNMENALDYYKDLRENGIPDSAYL